MTDHQPKPGSFVAVDGKTIPLRVLTIKDIRVLKGTLDLAGKFSPFADDDVIEAVTALICHQAEAEISKDQAEAAISLENFPPIWAHVLGLPVQRKPPEGKPPGPMAGPLPS